MKTVWITGASRGIGAATARAFAAAGWQVAIGWHRAADKAAALAAELNAARPGSALAVQTDVTDPAGVAAAHAAVRAALGPVDCLVNNAGIAKQQMLCDVTEEDWAAMFSSEKAAIMSVSMTPGATQLTRMLLGPSSLASASVKLMTAPLAAE